MKRLKSIDTLRGASMTWMLLAHLQHWWLIEEDMWIYDITWSILDVIGASAFLFISGISTAISYNNKIDKAKNSKVYNLRILKIEYFLRTLSILIIALIYNLIFAFRTNNILNIWTWFILLTIAISLFFVWPLLRTSKIFRIIIGVIIWVSNQILYLQLKIYDGRGNFYGYLYYFLYHPPDLNPIFSFFPFLLFGTVIGDVLYETYSIDNQKLRLVQLKYKFIIPLLIIGPILIITGILYNFPMFLSHRTFPWMIYTLGMLLVLISFLIHVEEFYFKENHKSYKFLFYFSYYSLSIYILHNLFFFLFYRQLNAFNIWFYSFVTILIVGLVLRSLYKIFGNKLSLKYQIAILCSRAAEIIDTKLRMIRFEGSGIIFEKTD